MRSAGVLLIAALGSYLMAMNVFLETRMFRSAITSRSGSLLVDYRKAYSLWPGRIHVEGLGIRGRDSNVEWILTLDRCDFDVSFLALVRRRFHASHVKGDGLSLRIRLRRDTPPSTDEARALPPIPGFLDPPVKDVGPPPPELTDANYNLWSIELDDVDAAHVRELWIDTVRYAGDLEVRGRWFFRPLRWLDIGPATVSLRRLDVNYGTTEPWFAGGNGELTFTMQPFSLQEIEGAETMHQVSIDGDVRGTARIANVMDRLLRSIEGTARVDRADDAILEAYVHLDHGILRSGTHVRLERLAVNARAGPLTIESGVITAQGRVDGEDTTHLDLGCTGVCRIAIGPWGTVQAGSLAGRFEMPALDLARLDNPLDLRGRVEGEDLAVRLEGASVAAPRFTAAATTRISAREAPLEGAVTLDAAALSVVRRDLEATADFSSNLVLSRWAGGGIEVSRGDVHLRGGQLSVKGVRMAVPRLAVCARSLAWLGTRPTGRLFVVASDVDLPLSLLPSKLLLLPKVVAIESGDARVAIATDFDVGRLAASGEAHVVADRVRGRVGEQALAGDLRLDVHARATDTGTDLSGTQLAFQGTVGDAAAPWWARAVLPWAILDARGGVHLHADATAAAKNGAPLVAVVGTSTAIPSWALKLVSTEGLLGGGELVISPSVFLARAVTAHAAGVDLGFELAELGAEREWALFLDLGVVSAGIHVADHRTDVMLFGAKSWFERTAASMRAAEQRYE